MSVQWVERNGQQILYFDHRDSKPDQIIANIEAGKQMVATITGGLRMIANFEGAVIDKTVMQHLKEGGVEVYEPITEKQAVVGIKGVRYVLLQAYNLATGAAQHQRLFDTEEEALAWVISD